MGYDNVPPVQVNTNITDDYFKKAVKVCDANASALLSGFEYVVWKACGLSDVAYQ